jgi:hypothetical protein
LRCFRPNLRAGGLGSYRILAKPQFGAKTPEISGAVLAEPGVVEEGNASLRRQMTAGGGLIADPVVQPPGTMT